MSDKFSYYRRAQDSVAQTALTNSKRAETFVKGVYPTHITRGQGAYLWDHQGKKYLDFIGALGANLLGYANDGVTRAICDQAKLGASHSLPSTLEVEAAEKLKELFPFVDAVKFLKTGTEACNAAIRIARAHTRKDIILSDGYHGWGDEFVSLTPPARGVPEIMDDEGYNLRPIFKLKGQSPAGVAGVIVEPVITDWSDDRVKFLHTLREDCTRHDALLIFDEIITGFRFPKFSVSNYFGVTPDLILLGKGIANGMPLAAVAGKADVMNGDYFVSSTFAGETLSLAAGVKTMTLLQNRYDLDWLWREGKAFLDQFNAIWPEKIRIEGYPTRGAFKGDELVRALFWQEACSAGMLFGPSWFFNFALAEVWKDSMVAIRAILERIQRGEIQLRGELPKTPFAQRTRS